MTIKISSLEYLFQKQLEIWVTLTHHSCSNISTTWRRVILRFRPLYLRKNVPGCRYKMAWIPLGEEQKERYCSRTLLSYSSSQKSNYDSNAVLSIHFHLKFHLHAVVFYMNATNSPWLESEATQRKIALCRIFPRQCGSVCPATKANKWTNKHTIQRRMQF